MRKQVGILFIGVGLVSALPSWASAGRTSQDTNKYLDFGSVQVEVFEEFDPSLSESLIYRPLDLPGLVTDLGNMEVILDKVINIGTRLWKLVESNKPVVNASGTSANALPSGVGHWSQLSGWSMPRAKIYRYTYRNLYGSDVVDFSYRVGFIYGGSVGGKGAYITSASISPAKVSVSWGYTFNSTAEVVSVTNAGTADSPIGAIELKVNWTVKTILKEEQTSDQFYLRGDGLMSNSNLGLN